MKHLIFFIILIFPLFAKAQDPLIIGQSVELSGEATGKENMEGAQAYFRWLNSQGGVHGRQIQLKTYDDKRNPATTRENTEKLIHQDNAIALFGYRSTPTVEAVLPLLLKEKVPLIAPFSGAAALHTPFNPYLFHLRASYQDEAAKMVESLAPLQIKRVAILYQDDSFGKDGLAGFERHLQRRQLAPLIVAKYDRKDLKIDAAVRDISATNPQAVLMACTPSACADFIREMRKTTARPQFLMLSNVNSSEFFSSLGDNGRGIGVMQVMPYPRDAGAPVAREFLRLLKGMANPPPASYAALEGFIAAKLLTEGLRRAGPNPTRQKLVTALETIKDLDLGGVTIGYSPTEHDGSRFVELIVVGKNGAIWR